MTAHAVFFNRFISPKGVVTCGHRHPSFEDAQTCPVAARMLREHQDGRYEGIYRYLDPEHPDPRNAAPASGL